MQRAQRAVGRAVPGEPQLGAEVRPPREADGAAAARHGRIEDHPLARARTGFDGADELVPEDERLRQDGVADRALDEPVPVGAAEADRRHANEQLALARLGRRLLVQAKVAGAVQSQRLHRSCP